MRLYTKVCLMILIVVLSLSGITLSLSLLNGDNLEFFAGIVGVMVSIAVPILTFPHFFKKVSKV